MDQTGQVTMPEQLLLFGFAEYGLTISLSRTDPRLVEGPTLAQRALILRRVVRLLGDLESQMRRTHMVGTVSGTATIVVPLCLPLAMQSQAGISIAPPQEKSTTLQPTQFTMSED